MYKYYAISEKNILWYERKMMEGSREYFFDVDDRGRLLHNGVELDDKQFVHILFTRLKENTSGKYPEYPYYSPCGYEINYIKPVDTPIVFSRWEHGKLWYGETLSTVFAPEKLRVSDDGILYHESKIGGYGRVALPALMHLGEQLQEFGDFLSFCNPENGFETILEPINMPPNHRIIRSKNDNSCFACGKNNSVGLQLEFIYNEQEKTAVNYFTAPTFMNGAFSIMHGGFVALLLDETMGKTLSGLNVQAPTANLNIQYRRPVPLLTRLHLVGKLISESGRKYVLTAQLISEEGIVLAEAEGLFIARKQNQQ